ncbi:hypothetical protein OIU76_028028 [Salix suchowensis]|nr:hypothetical protein OIU76_028028 [Salix suchowensis]
MYTTKKKIQKDKDAEPTEFEETVAQALFDLENSNSDLKSELKDLFINSAVQIDVAGNRKAIVIYVPYRLRKAYRKVHLRLVRELEKEVQWEGCCSACYPKDCASTQERLCCSAPPFPHPNCGA